MAQADDCRHSNPGQYFKVKNCLENAAKMLKSGVIFFQHMLQTPVADSNGQDYFNSSNIDQKVTVIKGPVQRHRKVENSGCCPGPISLYPTS
ncbi:hypothetical protein C8J23_10483 [Shewanella chilikensis]|uniref:Uncharacterized protein n=1 Tax=Shewanella chilikensis TaxID=558541 RepID=A0ABX5PRU4_9GAMM|nr:hypothetical protein C8J23_10483 [Shewanella chilikensis]BCV35407.1 hypothetical protein TUM17377_07350 [Shewanella chilikensis]GGZ16941.1 hypothetical protein GCM10007105_00760 [Shewanella chilikensis]GHB00493.1 hypothetical protein GCM10007107_11610 [Shewanella indica]